MHDPRLPNRSPLRLVVAAYHWDFCCDSRGHGDSRLTCYPGESLARFPCLFLSGEFIRQRNGFIAGQFRDLGGDEFHHRDDMCKVRGRHGRGGHRNAEEMLGPRRSGVLGEDAVSIEIKSVGILPMHDRQAFAYLRLSGIPVGRLMNFQASCLTDGLRGLVV